MGMPLGGGETSLFPEYPLTISPEQRRGELTQSANKLIDYWKEHRTKAPVINGDTQRHWAPLVSATLAGGADPIQPPGQSTPRSKARLSNQFAKAVMEGLWRLFPKLERACQQFWGPGVWIHPWAIADTPTVVDPWEAGYVTEIFLDEANQRFVSLRLSQVACEELLRSVLGEKPAGVLNDKQAAISGFDQYLLDRFHESVFNLMVDARLIDEWFPLTLQHQWVYVGLLIGHTGNHPLVRSGSLAEGTHVGLDPRAGAIGRLWLKVPFQAFTPDRVTLPMGVSQEPMVALDDGSVQEALRTPVIFNAGSTITTLKDIQQLRPGDLLTLEHSQPPFLSLSQPPGRRILLSTALRSDVLEAGQPQRQGRYTTRCTIPHLRQFPPLDMFPPGPPGVSPAMASQHPNLPTSGPGAGPFPSWDDLLIDVQASFDPIQMPLKQLKQVTQGLVLELGELKSKQIRLHVENKTLAFGELVIVGNQFGVLITDVAPSGPGGTPGMTPPPPPSMPDPQAGQPW